MPPSVKSFPSSVSTAVKHFIFSATILLSPPRSSGVQTPAYTHSSIQDWLIPFIANAFSVELGIWKWNKGAWLCGWQSREQALFVNRAPCCCAECSRGESAAFCLASSAHLAPEGPVWAQGRGKSIARKRSSWRGVRHCPACSPWVAGWDSHSPSRGWLPLQHLPLDLSYSFAPAPTSTASNSTKEWTIKPCLFL